MEATQDLFASSLAPVVKPAVRKAVHWRFATNHQNLFYMLAAGLLMPPEGFGKKYYRDTLEAFPGWLPLFPDVVPKTAVDFSVSEQSRLIPCLLTLDLSALRGPVRILAANGEIREAQFPEGLDGSEQVLLVPAPLPVCWIKSLTLASKAASEACAAAAADFSNVPFGDFKREVKAGDFSRKSQLAWPPSASSLPERRGVLALPFAAGGIMALLAHFADQDESARRASQAAFADADAAAQHEALLAPLAHWMLHGELPENADVSARLFWEIVNQLAQNRFSTAPQAAQDVVLEQLTQAMDRLEEKMRAVLLKLSGDLQKIASGFADGTVSELLERHGKPFSRALLLFFLREKCVDFLTFQQPLLNTGDRLAAAILFAAREGWIGLPHALRNLPGLSAAVSHRMAAMAQRLGGSELALGAPPPRPMSMTELFRPGERGWDSVQKHAALELARTNQWPCIQTRIRLGKGDYRLEVGAGGLQIILPGEVKAVESEVDQAQFLALLAQTPVSGKLEQKIRALFKA